MITKFTAGAFLSLIIIGGLGFYGIELITEDEKNYNFENYGKAPNFTLNNMNEEPVTFSDYTGKVRLITFIYTKCTAGCNTNVVKMLNILFSLNQKQYSANIEFFIIDFDYIHDNYTSLQEFTSIMIGENQMPDNLEFLFGTETEINQTAEDWNFYFEISKSPKLNVTSTDGGMEMNDTITTGDTMNMNDTMNMDDHPPHEVVWIHPFVIYLIDQNDEVRKKIWGLDWEQAYLEDMIIALF